MKADLGLPAQPGEYFDHIDGLRFVAVTLVLLFHGRVPGFAGGFIGVDIFFVISGFLMTRIVLKMPMNLAGIYHFYCSRFRRIVPAYLVAVAVTTIVASAVFLPVHLHMMMPALVSCPAFVSNVVFYRTTSYFSPDLTYNPLLHTWSLGVEWQFYLLYPFVFIVFRRLRFSDAMSIGVMALTSFALCIAILTMDKVIAAFYLLPTRMWEFAVGGAMAVMSTKALSIAVSRWLTALAMMAIVWCAIFYDRDTLFPGAAALVPCLATAILVREGSRPGFLHAFLTWRPVRLLGQSSYSIYLWHWPIIVFIDYGFVHFGAHSVSYRLATIVILSVAVGVLSWRFVETPFRHPDNYRSSRVAWLPAAAIVPLVFSLVIGVTGGLPQRFAPEVIRVSNAYGDVGAFRACLQRTASRDGRGDALCQLGAKRSPRSFLLLGDSHAAALADGLSTMAAHAGRGGVLSVSDACLPFLRYPSSYVPSRRKCEIAQQAIPALMAIVKPDAVFLHAAWGEYYRSDPRAFKAALETTLDWLATRKVRVYLIDDTPGARENVPIGLAKTIAFGVPFDFIHTSDYVKTHEAVRKLLSSAAREHGFIYLNVTSDLCNKGGNCEVAVKEHPLYWDAGHLSGYGSQVVMGDLARRARIDF